MKAVVYLDDIYERSNLTANLTVLGSPFVDLVSKELVASNVIDTVIVLGNSLEDQLFFKDKIRHIYIKAETFAVDLNLIAKYLDDKPFLLIDGNLLPDSRTVVELKVWHEAHLNDLTVSVAGEDSASGFRNFYLRKNKAGVFKDFSLENKWPDKMTGMFVINPELLLYDKKSNSVFYERFLNGVIFRNKKAEALVNPYRLYQFGSLESYYHHSFEMLAIADQFHVKGNRIHNSYYGENCEIDFSTEVHGLHCIGDNFSSGEQSFLQDNIIGQNVVLGDGCVVKNSILLDNVKVGANCELVGVMAGESTSIAGASRLNNIYLSAGSVLNKASGVFNVS